MLDLLVLRHRQVQAWQLVPDLKNLLGEHLQIDSSCRAGSGVSYQTRHTRLSSIHAKIQICKFLIRIFLLIFAPTLCPYRAIIFTAQRLTKQNGWVLVLSKFQLDGLALKTAWVFRGARPGARFRLFYDTLSTGNVLDRTILASLR